MPLLLHCATCDGDLQLRSRLRGRDIACPACGTVVQVPVNLDFSAPNRSSIRERKIGHRLLFWSLAAGLMWLPPLSALMWWWTSHLARVARREGRHPPEPVRIACVVAWVACVSQLLWWTVKIGPHLL